MRGLVQVMARPRWFLLAVLMAIVVPSAVRLGFWQIDRLEQRKASNQVWAYRLDSDPVSWDTIRSNLTTLGDEELRYLRVTVAGTFLGEQQVVVRNRALKGTNGNWVITPLDTGGTGIVAVLRGWVPFELSEPDDPLLAPPAGEVRLEGVLVPGEEPTGLGPSDPPDGHLDRMVLLDLRRLGSQVGADLGPAYIQQVDGLRGGPEVLPLPDVTDEGPHLAYVIQWFSFAVIGAVGFGALLRREVVRQAKEDKSVPFNP